MGVSSTLLEEFDAVEQLSAKVESGDCPSLEIRSKDLALGPLAELLVLRRGWRDAGLQLRLVGDSDARHAAIAGVSRAEAAQRLIKGTVGALHIAGEGEFQESEAYEFVAAAGKLAYEAGMPLDASRLLKGVLGELIDNVTEHAGPDARGLAAFELFPKSISLAVADSGRGVVRGYVDTRPELAGLLATDALEWAVQQHRSRKPEVGRGTGFSSVLHAMRAMDAALRVRSDEASIEIEGPADSATWLLREQPELRGFVVSLHLAWC